MIWLMISPTIILSKVPALKRSPVKVPTQLLEILIDSRGNWT